MRKIIIVIFVALFGLSIFMVGRKVWEYSTLKEDVIYFKKSQELDKKIEKVNDDIEKIKEDKKEELENLEKWQKTLEDLKENL